jgi:hypothetical protein
MATYYARKAGNINASDVWATTPSGTASAVTFATGDVLMANSFAITVNVSTNLGATGEVRNDTTGGATAGGSFALANGVTLTANVFVGTAPTVVCVTFSGVSGNTANIVGNCTGGTNNAAAVLNFSTGTLNITGNCTGGTATPGAVNFSTGTLNITGNCTGGNGANAFGASNATGVLNITGNCTGGSIAGAVGASNASTGTLLIDGVIQASEFAAGVGGANRAQVTLLTGPFLISPTFGVNPIANVAWRWASALNNQTYIEVGTQTLLQKRNLVTPDNATNFPTASDVRSGTAYGIAGVLSGTCVVPNPAQVAAGTPVDNTFGTLAYATASEIAAAVRTNLATELGRLDASVSSRLAPNGTLAVVTTLTNAPNVPSAVQIRAEIDSNSTQLAGIKAKTDLLNTTRLGQCTTTEILGNLLAQANS